MKLVYKVAGIILLMFIFKTVRVNHVTMSSYSCKTGEM